jgi:hypothetical protein
LAFWFFFSFSYVGGTLFVLFCSVLLFFSSCLFIFILSFVSVFSFCRLPSHVHFETWIYRGKGRKAYMEFQGQHNRLIPHTTYMVLVWFVFGRVVQNTSIQGHQFQLFLLLPVLILHACLVTLPNGAASAATVEQHR